MSERLASERMIVEEPTSFSGATKRIWRMTESSKALTIPLALVLIPVAWSLVLCWYAIFGIFLIPWRIINRGSKKRKLENLRHQELLQNR